MISKRQDNGDNKDNYLDDYDDMIANDDKSYYDGDDLDLDIEGHNHSTN